MRKRLGVLLAIVLAAALLAPLSGCVVIRRDGPPPKWLSSFTATSSAEATPTPAKAAANKESGPVVYMARKGRLVAAERPKIDGPNTVAHAMDELLAGPTAEERKAGLTTAIPGDAAVIGVSIDYGGHAIVDLSRSFAAGEADRGLRLAQVVYTLTEVPGVQSVIVYIDGRRAERFGPAKSLLRPQKRADYREFAP